MLHLPKYPKVLALGHRVISRIFDGPVEISEKIDGSQYSFAKVEDELICRTRRTTLYNAQPDKMFLPAIRRTEVAKPRIPEGVIFFGETLARPKHNVLAYDIVPVGHVALFAAMNIESREMYSYETLKVWADEFEMDIVSRIFEGEFEGPEQILELLDRESMLGGCKIEGVVVKNYAHDAMIGEGIYYPYLVGKYVSERFKEKQDGNKYGKKKTKSDWESYKDTYRTEARWLKAIQHLREDGSLLGEPKDIGPLMKEIQTDLEDEHKEEVMEFLYKLHRKELLGRATQGFAEWYKEQLLKGEINVSES